MKSRGNVTLALLTLNFAAMALLPLAGAGCSEREQPRPIRYAMIGPLFSEIPPVSQMTTTSAFYFSLHLWEPLIHIDPNGNLASDLLSDWSRSEDGLRWVFNLKPGLRWSDGTPIDASQVAASLTASLKGSGFNPGPGYLAQISAPTPHRVSILLTKFHIEWPSLLGNARHGIRPPEWAGKKIDLLANRLRCSGPYRLKSFTTEHAKLEPNPHFPGKPGKRVPPLELWGADEVHPTVEKFLARKFDAFQVPADLLSEPDALRLAKSGAQSISEGTQSQVSYLGISNRGRRKIPVPLRQLLLRKLNESALKAEGIIPIRGLTPLNFANSPDPMLWQSWLSQLPTVAARPELSHEPLEIFVMKGFQLSRIYRRAVGELRSLGVPFHERIYDPQNREDSLWKRRLTHDYDLIFLYSSLHYSSLHWSWRNLLTWEKLSPSPISEQDLDALAAAEGPEATIRQVQRLEQKILADPFLLPLSHAGSLLYLHPDLKTPRFRVTDVLPNLSAMEWK